MSCSTEHAHQNILHTQNRTISSKSRELFEVISKVKSYLGGINQRKLIYKGKQNQFLKKLVFK